MHILAPGGRLEDLAALSRDDLPRAGLSPTHMEAIQGFAEWYKRGITPTVGLLMWYLESVQREDGSFLRTEDATLPSIGVAVRFLQIAGQLGIHRGECESVERGARWLESQIGDDGLIRMPITGLVDFGMLARTIHSLYLVSSETSDMQILGPATAALLDAQIGPNIWPTYPDTGPSVGATSLCVNVLSVCKNLVGGRTASPHWLLEVRNPDGGWGEYAGSPSRFDNTFWAARACVSAGVEPSALSPTGVTGDGKRSDYDRAMVARTAHVLGERADEPGLPAAAIQSLDDEMDRYATTALLGLAVSEAAELPTVDRALPIRTPEFIRREPPLYDQLAHTGRWPWWTTVVDRTARARLAEASIGWLAGLSAAIAVVGEEFVNGLASLPTVPLICLSMLGVLVILGWVGAQQKPGRRLAPVAHVAISGLIAGLLVLLIRNPANIDLPLLPTTVLGLLLTAIIEAVATATDKADLLNRLRED